MIFTSEEVGILNRVILRKGCEIAKKTLDPSLMELRRYMWADYLARQMAGARLMICLAKNDLSDLAEQMDLLDRQTLLMPEDMYAEYVKDLSSRNMEDEAQFISMVCELYFQRPLLTDALRLSSNGVCSTLGIEEKDAVECRKELDIIERLRHRTSGQDPEVLGNSIQYMDAILHLLRVIMMIHAYKFITSQELSDVIRELDSVDEDAFDALFGDILTDEEESTFDFIRSRIGTYITAIYARCILNSL